MAIKDQVRYSVYVWDNEKTWACLSWCERWKTEKGALRWAARFFDFPVVVVRKDEIFYRDENNEISASGPIHEFRYGKAV